MKVPLTFKVPAPENVTLEEVPADVMSPLTVMAPVESVRSVYRLTVLTPARAIEPADKVPAPTAIAVVKFAAGLAVVMAPDTLRPLVAPAKVMPLLAVGAEMLTLVQAAVYAAGIVTVMVGLMVTVSPATGTELPPHVAVLFQLPVTLAVRAAAHTAEGLRSKAVRASARADRLIKPLVVLRLGMLLIILLLLIPNP